MSSQRAVCYSAGADATIRVWELPGASEEPYACLGNSIAHKEDCFVGHTDAVWEIVEHPVREWLLSASSDGSVRLWSLDAPSPLLMTYRHMTRADTEFAIPTSVTPLHTDLNKILVGYATGEVLLFDIETGTELQSLQEPLPGGVNTQVNKVISHSTLPLAITSHEDGTLRFFDTNSARCIHDMVGHEDSVSSLCFDHTSLYFVSASHDSSLRFWDVGKRVCVQELSAHRKKLDESIHAVASHPSKPTLASGGADSVIKIYQA
eukprot:TRINITY_DN15921_c0_g1::TRINITY_DN15921_c0_g1_i1::g.22464::m.22464 TRINITY_DN15921_c0_g1::TRINITY_DN15921_c0_g1_i1::g.22464  ORF type:complete len:263 (+),score=54.84,sp/A5D7H2/STRN3_BOVIN/40.84/1e-62,WD40/PF00400.27/0.28,WD40/PF00400.27/4.9e-06,WD40/PF00400.27/59,WD40/PF00400.27/3.3e-09,WD40/PF00400.27/1.8e+03,WD40/PF00400.27/0.0015,Nucleoporin_N/PF08801.6/4.8e+02,Nucleoporin_N/PF08801.6/0.028,Nucleoporin_N/PF08801.6/0.17 TRINITY_DN15921_c0_g1_i1:528-1316(+)